MMNLKDLNKIDLKDLKNVNWGEAKDQLLSRPDALINILLVIATLAIVYVSFNKYSEAKKASELKLADLRKRLAAIEQFEVTQKQHDAFLKDIPKAIADDQLVQTLSEFALRRNVQILSFSPERKKSNALVSLTSVRVNIASDDYANIILFVHDIEKSSHPIRIENWNGSAMTENEFLMQRAQRSSRRKPEVKEKIEHIKATITIESVELQNV